MTIYTFKIPFQIYNFFNVKIYIQSYTHPDSCWGLLSLPYSSSEYIANAEPLAHCFS